jgi:hypothetical protein
VAGEEGHVQAQVMLGGDVADLRQIRQRLFAHLVRRRLKIIPQQEQADDGQAEFLDESKFLFDFIGVEI